MMLVRIAGWASLPGPQELELMLASGWWLPAVPSMVTMSASNRPWLPKSPLLQLSPPTTSWFAPGAMS